MANIINEYFKVIKNVEEIDVFEMYNMFIHQWNRELPYKDSMFVGMSAFTFMVILDSFEAILSQKELPCNSVLLCQDYDILDALDRSKCWGDVRLRKVK